MKAPGPAKAFVPAFRRRQGLFLAALIMLTAGVTRTLCAESESALSTIAECLAQVRSRTNNPPAINLTATVTLVDQERGLLYLQDDSAAMAVQTSFTGQALKPGQRIKLESSAVAQYVRAFPAYPDQPDTRSFLATFETPSQFRNYYLTRIRGYLHPPVTGQYRFWTAADDAAEFFLSVDATPSRAKRIAMNRIGNATGSREWDRYSPQRSQPVTLTAGETYYVEALYLQGFGRDTFAVAWEGPGLERAVIANAYLTPWRENLPTGPTQAGNPAGTNGLLCERWNDFVLREFEALRPRNSRESFVRCSAPKISVLDAPGLPQPLVLASEDNLSAVSNFTWVELEGDVEFAAGNADRAQLTLRREAQTLPVRVLDWPGALPKDLTYSHVKVRGVLEHTYGPKGEWLDSVLWVPDRVQLEIVAPVSSLGAATPLVPICEIEPANPQMSWGRRVKVHGRIVGTTNGLLVVEGYDQYQAQCSTDGRTWVTIGKPVEAWMSDPLLTGLALASSHNQNAAIANFDRLSGWGTNWSCADVGNAIQPGVVSVREGKPLSMLRMGSNPAQPADFSTSEGFLKLKSVSRQIGERVDQHFFVYQTNSGGGEFSARLELEHQPTMKTLLGIMVRESLAPRSPYVAVLFTAAGGPVLQYRRTTGELTVGFPAQPELAQHRWLKLIKRKSQLLVRGQSDAIPNQNQELEITGVVTWQNHVPVLDAATFGPTPPALSNLVTQASTPEQRLSIAGFVAKAQHPPEPFLANRLAASGLKGVVTFSDRVQGTNLLFVQQGHDGGIQVGWPDNNLAPKFRVGQLVELSGAATVRTAPVLLEPQAFKVTGWGSLPEPAPYSAALVNNDSGQSRWVEASGVVRSSDTNGLLRLMTSAGLLRVWIGQPPATEAAGDYSDQVIRARGVLSLAPDQTPTLLVPSFEFVEIQEEPPPDPFAIPRFTIAQLATLEIKPEQQRRIKISGRVTCRLRQGIFVQDETGGAFLQISPEAVALGDSIEAVGFPMIDASAVALADVKLRSIAGKPKTILAPTSITRPEQFAADQHTHTLVNVSARLLEQEDKPEGQLLTLQFGALLFEAALLTNVNERLPELPIGSRVSVSGVLQINPTVPRSGGTRPKNINAASPFTLWLRQAADVAVLERPPWWTVKRVAWAGGLFAGGLLGALIWVRILRRRVAQKQRELQATMNQLAKETRTSAVLGERDRLAGEIHDSLQQGLAAIILQLDVANKHADAAPEARRLLRMARGMAEFSRAEVEHAVWDLQSPLLDNADLGTALTHVANLISTGEPQVTVEILGSRRPLPSATEHHLLRMGQEAITNAVKHAQAKTIRVTLDYSGADFELIIQDDGKGFVPAAFKNGEQAGHFGLHGIHARAKKIDAQLNISSQPSQGTTITVRLRLNPNPTILEPTKPTT